MARERNGSGLPRLNGTRTLLCGVSQFGSKCMILAQKKMVIIFIICKLLSFSICFQ